MQANDTSTTSTGMRTVALDSFGGPEVLSVQSAPIPVPLASQVRIRVSHATVNPTDLLFRSGGQIKTLESSTGPWVPGMELAGVVDSLGANVRESDLKLGDRVVALVNPRRSEGGAYATLICLSPSSVALRPASISAPEAATLPMNGVTAVMTLEFLGLVAGESILVTGGAGALGGYVIQLARAAGLTIVAHGRARDEETMRGLGATHVLSGDDSLPSSVRALFPKGVDGLVDTARLGIPAEAAVKDGGMAVHVRSASGYADTRLVHRTVLVADRVHDQATLQQVMSAAEKGILTTRVARVMDMTQAAEAHRIVESGGLRGRVVLDLQSQTDLD